MYIPSSYAVKSNEAIEQFIQTHPFAVLVSLKVGKWIDTSMMIPKKVY